MASQADPSTGPVDRMVGDQLRRHRERLGLTQAEVARALGVSEKTWGRHETGVRIPFVRLARFCDAYALSIQSLFDALPLWGDGLERPAGPPSGLRENGADFVGATDGDWLKELFNHLSPSEQRLVLSAARGISRRL